MWQGRRCVLRWCHLRDASAPSYMAAKYPTFESSHQPEYPVRRTFSGVNEETSGDEFLRYFENIMSSILGILKNQDRGGAPQFGRSQIDNGGGQQEAGTIVRWTELSPLNQMTDTEAKYQLQRPNKEVDVREREDGGRGERVIIGGVRSSLWEEDFISTHRCPGIMTSPVLFVSENTNWKGPKRPSLGSYSIGDCYGTAGRHEAVIKSGLTEQG
ncbi:unnamed protein product [Mytilus coruscus]|uniref:Uncharacterized protein n=1 Tax=Mytilus coruscus TaxID=42192 RepID=A0A6J8AHG8_MYTCO|nr:unnamed protein product [Mytilus coruscus]